MSSTSALNHSTFLTWETWAPWVKHKDPCSLALFVLLAFVICDHESWSHLPVPETETETFDIFEVWVTWDSLTCVTVWFTDLRLLNIWDVWLELLEIHFTYLCDSLTWDFWIFETCDLSYLRFTSLTCVIHWPETFDKFETCDLSYLTFTYLCDCVIHWPETFEYLRLVTWVTWDSLHLPVWFTDLRLLINSRRVTWVTWDSLTCVIHWPETFDKFETWDLSYLRFTYLCD